VDLRNEPNPPPSPRLRRRPTVPAIRRGRSIIWPACPPRRPMCGTNPIPPPSPGCGGRPTVPPIRRSRSIIWPACPPRRPICKTNPIPSPGAPVAAASHRSGDPPRPQHHLAGVPAPPADLQNQPNPVPRRPGCGGVPPFRRSAAAAASFGRRARHIGRCAERTQFRPHPPVAAAAPPFRRSAAAAASFGRRARPAGRFAKPTQSRPPALRLRRQHRRRATGTGHRCGSTVVPSFC